tara:strand:- start:29 stop:931 length:903 start_codon:yes stop_codon:yes gene_type:complete
MHDIKRRALGSSPLDELGIRDLLTADSGSTESMERDVTSLMIDVSTVKPNPYQPRKHFSATSLEQLAQSIKAQGLLQPIVVRVNQEGVYELIAGERRLRASQMAGLDKIPAVVKEISDQACLAFAIIENIQRQDLNVIELAQSLHSLATKYGMTHSDVGRLVGKSRAAVSNVIRLLQLSSEVKVMLVQGFIDMGHARCLLSLPEEDQASVAQKIVDQQLPVRDAEALVRSILGGESKKTNGRFRIDPAPRISNIVDQLAKHFTGIKCNIKAKESGGGVLSIQYSSDKDIEALLQKIQPEQ